jgi:hypothetical protein
MKRTVYLHLHMNKACRQCNTFYFKIALYVKILLSLPAILRVGIRAFGDLEKVHGHQYGYIIATKGG